jgi:hypothetical protein
MKTISFIFLFLFFVPISLYLLLMIFLIVLLLVLEDVMALIVGNRSVISYGGPGTMSVFDICNKDGDWNRSYHPSEP